MNAGFLGQRAEPFCFSETFKMAEKQLIPVETNHANIVTRARSAVEWLRSQTGIYGISRYDRYVKVWQEIVDSSDLPSGGTSEHQIERIQRKFGPLTFRGAAHEIADLIHIHEAFLNQDIPRELLRKVVQGRDCEIEERGDEPNTLTARNFLFELTTATTLKTNGFSVKLGGQADIISNFHNHRIFVECKRSYSERGLERNISKVAKQLQDRFDKFGLPVNCIGQIPVGIIALSATKLINPNQDYLKAPSLRVAANLLNCEIDKLWLRRRALILKKCHRNTIATGFFVRCPVIVPEGFGSFRRWKFFAHQPSTHLSAISALILNQLKSE